MVPLWLHVFAWVWWVATFVAVDLVVVDLARRPQRLGVMTLAWPLTVLSIGPPAVWLYWRRGRARAAA